VTIVAQRLPGTAIDACPFRPLRVVGTDRVRRERRGIRLLLGKLEQEVVGRPPL